MADQKVSDLSSLTTPASEDLLLVVDNPNGTPASKSITLKNLLVRCRLTLLLTGSPPMQIPR